MPRPPFRSSLPTFAALYLFVACSNESNDFFGGTAGAGTGGALSGAGGSSAAVSGAGGSSGRGPMPGAGSSAGGSSATGGSGDTAGSSGTNAGSSATAGASAGGTAGAGGADDAGMGGDGGEAVAGSAGTPEETGGAGGTAGGGTDAGGTAGGGTAGGGAAGTSAGSSGTDAGGTGGAVGGSGGKGGAGGKGGTGCQETSDCDDDEYCEKVACADEEGTCAPQPSSCVDADATFDPVCGCDGMTYYTPCVAAREGVNVKAAGECTGSGLPTCTRQEGGDSCEPHREGARCYRPRVGCEGVSANMGVCWVLPDACPDEPKVHTYCGGTTGNAECVGLCEVLEREDAVYRDSPSCPE